MFSISFFSISTLFISRYSFEIYNLRSSIEVFQNVRFLYAKFQSFRINWKYKIYFQLIKERWIFLKAVKILNFQILSGWIEKYKPGLSKLDSSWDNSYWARLVIFSLAVNIGKLQPLASEDNFFCWVCNDFCSNLLLCNIRIVNSRKLFW